MLNLNPQTVCYIIQRARQFHVKEQIVIPDKPDSPTDDWALQVLADHEGDLTLEEALLEIEGLEPDQKATLVALMWLGRGDYSLNEREPTLKEATENLTDHTGAYLMRHPLVVDYLQEGLSQHGYSCQEYIFASIRACPDCEGCQNIRQCLPGL